MPTTEMPRLHPTSERPGRPDRRRWPCSAVVALAIVVAVTISLPAIAGPSPQRTVRIRAAAKGQPNGAGANPQISSDGRFVAFDSAATNLGPADPNGHLEDVYLYGAASSQILLLSTPPDGSAANGPSSDPSVSADGSVVAFYSRATNLVSGASAAATKDGEVFAWTRGAGLQQVSLSSTQAPAGGDSGEPDVSADGTRVAFSSTADNLSDGHPAGQRDVYVRDLGTGQTTLVSATSGGGAGDGASSAPAISPDGRYVSFSTAATNLVPGMTLSGTNVVVRNLDTGTTELASVSSSGAAQSGGHLGASPLSSDIASGGRYVVFESQATNLVKGDTNGHTDIFVRDTTAKHTSRASLAATGQQSDGDSYDPSISPDGRYVTYLSRAYNLTPRQPAGVNVFVSDLVRHTTVLADATSTGRPRGPEQATRISARASSSEDGSAVAFVSSARNLVADKKSRLPDVFIRHLVPAPITVASSAARLAQGHVVITFLSTDPQAGGLLCHLDARAPAICPLGSVVLPLLAPGTHKLTAYAGGPGSQYAVVPTVVRIVVRRGGRARVTVKNPGSALGIG